MRMELEDTYITTTMDSNEAIGKDTVICCTGHGAKLTEEELIMLKSLGARFIDKPNR